jgi:hypothetical protein
MLVWRNHVIKSYINISHKPTVKFGYNDPGYNEENIVVFLGPNEALLLENSQL